jgi:hypothetical protein
MKKRNRAIALGGILAIAGCSGGGGSAAAPAAKPAQAGNRPLSTGRFTINPTLLRHASSKRRSPAFVDAGGGISFSSGSVFFRVYSQSNDGLNPGPIDIPITYGSTAPITVSLPLYGPDGAMRVKELYQLSSVAPLQILADTQSGGVIDTVGDTSIDDTVVQYHFPTGGVGGSSAIEFFVNGGSAQGALTLNAVAGGVVLADTPDGSGGNTLFVPANNTVDYLTFTPSGNFVYAFPADAVGGFTNLSAPGGFAAPVVLDSNFIPNGPSGGLVVLPTSVQGAFTLGNTSCSELFPGAMGNVSFTATDVFGHAVSTGGGAGSLEVDLQGYLNSTCPG